jgi:hypothetical protein
MLTQAWLEAKLCTRNRSKQSVVVSHTLRSHKV